MKRTSIKHLNIRIYGQVQGVLFRDSAAQKASELGVRGFVRNESDGSILIEAEGSPENLNAFLNWCQDGPPLAEVERVEQEEIDVVRHFKGFRVE